MNTRQHALEDRRFKHLAIATAKTFGIVIALAFLTHMSWNMFAPDLFGLPELRAKQALGLVVFAGLIGFLLTHGARPRRHG